MADFEHSELLLYKNFVLEESGDHHKAASHLKEIKPYVVDHRAWKEAYGRISLKAHKNEEALTVYEGLLKISPDNLDYVRGLCEAKGYNLGKAHGRLA